MVQTKKMKRKMIVDHGVIRKIARRMGYSANTVSLALKGETDSQIAEDIRMVARRDYQARFI